MNSIRFSHVIFCSFIFIFLISCLPQGNKIILSNGTHPDDYQIDPYSIIKTSITDDIIDITVSYSGGCATHKLTLVAYNYFMESFPVQADILLTHDSADDPCDAIVSEELSYNLQPLKDEYRKYYPNSAPDDVIVLRLLNPNEPDKYIYIKYALGTSSGEVPEDFGEEKSSLERNLNPDISISDVATLVQGNTAFAMSLYHELCDLEDGANIFYSPYSISAALAMLFAGAEANTETQMANTLNFSLPEATVHAGFNYLDLELESRGQGASGADGGKFRLNIANAVWGQEGYQFQSDFLDVLAVNYAAGLFTLDFISTPEDSRLTINQWVADQTEDRITDLIPKGSIDSLTRMVLTNAVYFNAAWAIPFMEASTQNELFYLLDQSTVTIPMMRQVAYHGYADGDNFQAVSLLYDGFELEMIIIMPDSGAFEAVESNLDKERLSAILAQMQHTNIDISLPKWEYKSKFNLNDVLSAMGMTDAFNPSTADLSGINGAYDLYVQSVLHEAFVKVNEAGTEAAAATAVIIGETSAPPPPKTVKANRPFVYLIRDIQTKTVLFVGRIMNPE